MYRVTIEASDGTTTAKRDVIVTVTNETEVVARPNSAATGAPTITGTAQVGETLTADTSGIADADGLTNVSYSYQWTADNGTGDLDITGATNSTYTLVDEDAGKTIKVEVSFTDDAENAESLTSAATAAVAATVPGVPGGLVVTVNDTGKLDLSWEAPDKDGGSAIAGYKVQWKETDRQLGHPCRRFRGDGRPGSSLHGERPDRRGGIHFPGSGRQSGGRQYRLLRRKRHSQGNYGSHRFFYDRGWRPR